MSVITSYTIACDKKLDGGSQCAKVIGPYLTLSAAQAAAEAAGWKLTYGHFRLDGDRCADHIAMLDRADWNKS